MFKKQPPAEDPNTGPLSFPKNYKFPKTKDLPKVEALVLEHFFQELDEFRKVEACE